MKGTTNEILTATMLKKILLFFIAFAMIVGVGTFALAEETPNSSKEYLEYLQLVSDGILDEEITFEYWQQLNELSSRLEAELEQSTQFTLVYNSLSSSSSSSYSMEAGDVFITNATSSKGLTGHAGIAISSTKILHIAGPDHNPETVTLSQWHTTYTDHGWTKVYRHEDSEVASAAAKWAKDTYEGSDAEYKIDMRLDTTHETYCSKIVWQAYYYGPDSHHANGPTIGVRLPYDLPITIHNLSLVKTFDD